MNPREKLCVVLLSFGLILAFLPLSSNRSFTATPRKVLTEATGNDSYLSADQVAKIVVSEDNTVQLIDLRSPEEFNSFNIPGALNAPYEHFLDKDPDRILNNGKSKYILYSNGDLYSNYAFVIASGLKYKNVYVLKGGLNEWFKTVMNSTFSGERISARENSLFETRLRARKIFTEINSLPDSLKQKYFESKRLAAKKLDGGCE